MSVPRTICPPVGWVSPARVLVSVVLPAPLRPTRPIRSPEATRNVASLSSTRAPTRSSTPWAVITQGSSRARVGGTTGWPTATGGATSLVRHGPDQRWRASPWTGPHGMLTVRYHVVPHDRHRGTGTVTTTRQATPPGVAR